MASKQGRCAAGWSGCWLLVALVGCSSSQTVGADAGAGGAGGQVGKPAAATVNGYTVDYGAGSVRFSVSAVDAQGHVLGTGAISDVTLSDLKFSLAVGPSSSDVTGAAEACGDIEAYGPVSCGIALDATGSMGTTDPQKMRNTAAKEFVGRMASADRGAVASFDTDTEATEPYLALKTWSDFTADKNVLDAAIDQATLKKGTTNLWDATYDGPDWVGTAGGSNPVALVLTDGGDNESTKTSDDAAAYAAKAGLRVFMVGLSDGIDSLAMQQVAAKTGGLYASADDADELTAMFDAMYNATQASGCIEATFLVKGVKPPLGRITGTLGFSVSGQAFSASFRVDYTP